jgi:PAS domain-containing protein
VLPGLIAMQPVTGLCMGLSGLALVLAARGRAVASGGIAALVLLLALQTLAQYRLGADFGTDRLLFPAAVMRQPLPYPHPGRMSEAGGVAFVLLATALLLGLRARTLAMAQLLAVTGLLFVGISLLGYLYNVRALYGVGLFSALALHTAAGLFVLLAGTLALWPGMGLLRGFTGGPGTTAARFLLPVVVLAPIGLSWLTVQGSRAGLYDPDFQIALLTATTVAMLAGAVLWNAARLDRAGQALAESERRLRAFLDNAEAIVWLIVWLKDLEGRFLIANRCLRELLGLPEERILGRCSHPTWPGSTP